MVVEKLPPHDTEAEEAVIASLLVDPDAIYRVGSSLKSEDFFREKNAWVFEACLSLWDRREMINQITVSHELARRDRLEEIGGAAYLSQLITDLPTPLGAEYYAQIIQRDASYRKLIGAAQQIVQLAYQGGPDIAGALGRAETMISSIRGGETLQDFVHIRDLLAEYKFAEPTLGGEAQEATAIRSGFMDLDTLLGGLKRSDLIIVAARPSLGKTSLSLNFARNAAVGQKATVAVFSLEMAAEQLVQRLIALDSGVDSTRLRLGQHTDKEERRVMQAMGRLAEANIFIDDAAMPSVAEVKAKARRLQMERGLDMVIIDFLQLMQGGSRFENRVQEIGYITRSLKGLARDLEVPVVALSQLSRAPEVRATHIPQLSDLRESGSIEQDADVVMFIYREDVYLRKDEWERMHPDKPTYPAGIAQIIVAKHRNGPTGTIHLRFRDSLARFEDLLVRDAEEWEGES